MVMESPPKLSTNSSIAANSIRKTLQAMHQAHKLLIGQAGLIRSVFPQGLDALDFQEKARQRSNTAGAPDVLNFLRNHINKLNMELTGMPGASAAASLSPDKTSRGAPPQLAQEPPKGDDPAAGKITSTAQLQTAISNLVS